MSPCVLEPGLKKNNLLILFHPDCHRRFWNFTQSALKCAWTYIKITTGGEFHSTPENVLKNISVIYKILYGLIILTNIFQILL